MVNHWEKLPKSKRSSSKSYSNIVAAVTDDLIPAKLHFLSFVAGILESFLVKYQCDEPVIPFLYSDLLKVMNRALLLALKPNIVCKCSTVTELKNIDLTNKDNFLKAKDINQSRIWCKRMYH